MSLQAQTHLLGRFIRDAQRLGFDAVAEPFGAALPLLPRSVARPEVLNRLLREHGIGLAADASVTSVRDVQYFLINSMEQYVLAANEQALIAHYLAELGRHGMTLGREEAWAQYRAYAFQTLMTSVVSLGLGTMTDMDEVLEVILARSVAAIRRTDFAGWLEALG